MKFSFILILENSNFLISLVAHDHFVVFYLVEFFFILVGIELTEGIVAIFPHYSVEIVEAYQALLMDRSISLCNHISEFIVTEIFSNLRADFLQIFEGNLARIIIVEELEHFEDFVSRVTLWHDWCNDPDKFIKSK